MKIACLVYGRIDKLKNYDNLISHLKCIPDFYLSSDNPSSELLEEFIQLYKPISYTCEPITYTCDLGKYPGLREETNINNMTRHFINKKRVFELVKKSGKNYDIYICLRIDLIYKTEFFLQNVIRKTLYIPCGEDHCGINDQIAYGNFDSMERYCNIFDNTIFLLESKLSIPHPESLHHANIKYNNLQVTRFFLDYVIDR